MDGQKKIGLILVFANVLLQAPVQDHNKAHSIFYLDPLCRKEKLVSSHASEQ